MSLVLDCGASVSVSVDEFADYSEEHGTLTTLEDGTKYQDYTYAVIADNEDGDDNLSLTRPTLTVEYDGVDKQTLAIPQHRPNGASVNPGSRDYYFFGCFRPQFGFVDTRGAGFYRSWDFVVAGLDVLDVGLCKELLNWPLAGTGYNPYV